MKKNFMRNIGLMILIVFVAQFYSCHNDKLETENQTSLPINMAMSLDMGFDTAVVATRALLTPGEISADGEIFSLDDISEANSTLLERATLFCPAMRDDSYHRLAAFCKSDSSLIFRLWDDTDLNTDPFVPYLYHLNSRAVQKAYLYIKGESSVDEGVIDMLQGTAIRQQNAFHFDMEHIGSKVTIILNVKNGDPSLKVTDIEAGFQRYIPSYTYTEDGTTYKDISLGDFSEATDMKVKWSASSAKSDIFLTHQQGADIPENLFNTLVYPQSLKGKSICVTINKPSGDLLYTMLCDSIRLVSPLVGDTRTHFTEIKSGEHAVITVTLDLNERLTGYAAVCDWYNATAATSVTGENVREGAGLEKALVTDIDYLQTEDVFRIYTPLGLSIFRDIVNAANIKLIEGYSEETPPNNIQTINGRLVRDMDLSTYTGTATSWKGIGGTAAQAYRGNFDGCGFTISKMNLTNAISRGLFCYVGDGQDGGSKKEIKNINFKDVLVSTEAEYVGVLAGRGISNYIVSDIKVQGVINDTWKGVRGGLIGHSGGNVEIKDCTVDLPLEIKQTGFSSNLNYGGFVGLVRDDSETDFTPEIKLTNCHFLSDISFTKNRSFSNVGGLLGKVNASAVIKDCTCKGNVSGRAYVGGLVGYVRGTLDIDNCQMDGTVTVQSTATGEYFGGLVGRIDGNATMNNCRMLGSFVKSECSYTGGLIGGTIGALNLTNSYSRALFLSVGTLSNGGLVGKIGGAAQISECYAISHIYGNYLAKSIGGLIGVVAGKSTVSDCYATGNVIGNGDAGGLIGTAGEYMTIQNCYATGNISKHESAPFGSSFGGLLGCMNVGGYVSNCHATGDIYGGNVGSFYIGTASVTALGGLVGAIKVPFSSTNSSNATTSIVDSYALGSVKAFGGTHVGGLIGYTTDYYMKLDNCTAGCDLAGGQHKANSRVESAVNGNNIGGLCGSMRGAIENCTSRHEVFGNYANIGGIVGMFGNDAVISDDMIHNCHVSENVYGSMNVGGIVGYTTKYILIEKCSFTGDHVGYYPEKYDNANLLEVESECGVGGIAGQVGANATIKDCHSTSEVIGLWDVGGVLGASRGENCIIKNSYATGTVILNSNIGRALDAANVSCGGLIGRLVEKSTVSDCYAGGKVSSNNYYTGGLIGALYKANNVVTNSYATGNVTCNKEKTGGLIGGIGDNTRVQNCYATGNISGKIDVGGLIGEAKGSDTIVSSYAKGDINGEERVGGLLGSQAGISNLLLGCSSLSKRIYSSSSQAGGLVGKLIGGKVCYCYSNSIVSGVLEVGGLAGNTKNTTIASCYTTGTVTGKTNVGAFVGFKESGSLTHCAAYSFWGDKGLGLYNGSQNVLNSNINVTPADVRTILMGYTETISVGGITYSSSVWSTDTPPLLLW